MSQTTKPTILYVDDDIDDCEFLSESLEGTSTGLMCASDGDEAIHLLHAGVAQNDLPSLIILDMNMPRKNGRQTLEHIKSQPQLAGIPVVIFSTSNNAEEREACARLGAVSYEQKPWHLEGYRKVVHSFLSLVHPTPYGAGQ